MDRLYPSRGAESAPGGAAMKCILAADGRLQSCRVLSERPLDFGFGAAVLKMAPLFRVDMARTPAAKAGQSVMLMVKFRLPESITFSVGLQPGDTASLVTVIKGRPLRDMVAVPCPSTSAPDRQCAFHTVEWTARPTWERSDELLSGADQTSGMALMECRVAAGGELTACKVDGASARNQAAMLELAKDFRAPERAIDGTRTAGGRIVLKFDWSVISELKGFRNVSIWGPMSPRKSRR